MKKILYPFIFVSILVFSCTRTGSDINLDPTNFVDPFIGTQNMGNTNPGAATPWGMVTVSPHNIKRGLFMSRRDPTPYHSGNPYMFGFSHVAISGVGCHGSGSILFMPITGDLKLNTDEIKSTYSKEVATPGFYKVHLDDWNVNAEMTSTTRSGISRYTFPGGPAHVVLNLGFSVGHVRNGWARIVSDTEIEGYKPESWFCGFCDDRKVYFVARFSKPSIDRGVFLKGEKIDAVDKIDGEMSGVYFSFDTKEQEEVYLKVGISFVSIENARENLDKEQPHFEFAQTLQAAQNSWKKELSKILVKGGSQEDKTKFYTALYHCLLNPHIFQDANGDYVKMQTNEIGHTEENRYSVFSLWDTYRSLHPLLALVYPDKQVGMAKSMLGMYKESGWLPLWELRGDETYCMVGDPATSVIADTYVKGLLDENDAEVALEAMVKQASVHEKRNPLRRCVEEYEKYGYIPHEYEQHNYMPQQKKPEKSAWGTVSVTLEFAYADWALAQAAQKMARNDIYEKFYKRSQNYKYLYDKESGFFRSRLENGTWREPFNPTDGLRVPGNLPTEGVGYCEGSAWNYAFFVPHDIPGIIDLMGGNENFVQKLQTCFDENYFDMGNEPDITFPYLFNYVKGQEWRTQKTVNDLINRHFKTGPDGLPGNDDLGTMSAWLVFSMMGIFPDCPGSNTYQITSPVFDQIDIQLDADFYTKKIFTIKSNRSTSSDFAIQSMTLNKKRYDKFNLSHKDITNGGILDIQLGDF